MQPQPQEFFKALEQAQAWSASAVCRYWRDSMMDATREQWQRERTDMIPLLFCQGHGIQDAFLMNKPLLINGVPCFGADHYGPNWLTRHRISLQSGWEW